MEYFYAADNQQRGPHSLEQLATLGLKPDTLVWRDGMAEWTPAGQLPELASLFAAPAPAVPQQQPVYTPAVTPSVTPVPVVASQLGYQTLPSDGSHNGMAIASLVLGIVSLVTWFCYFFGFIPGVLAIIFGVLARKQIKRAGGQGYGMATAGLVCGSISIAIIVIFIAVFVIIGITHH